MYTLHHLKHKLLSVWLLIGISLAFGYETQAQTSVITPVELVESYATTTKSRVVSYTKLVNAIDITKHVAPYTLFSFTTFLALQQQTLHRQTEVLQEVFLHTKPSLRIRLLQRISLPNDTEDHLKLS